MQLLKILLFSTLCMSPLLGEDKGKFPFHEAYLKDSDFSGFLKVAKEFLKENQLHLKHQDLPMTL